MSSDCNLSESFPRSSSSSGNSSDIEEIQSLSSEESSRYRLDGLIIGREIEEIPSERWLPDFGSSRASYDKKPSPGPAEIDTNAQGLPNNYGTATTRDGEKRGPSMFGRIQRNLLGKNTKKLLRNKRSYEAKCIIDRVMDTGDCAEFRYEHLADATDGFSENKVIGQGGSAVVYLGHLGDPVIAVAIKRYRDSIIFDSSGTELKVGRRLRHRNVVRLLGWCHDEETPSLVYEFVANGSLFSHLHETASGILLPWPARYKILVDVASALNYLHEELDECVIHRDVKSSNIMLDTDFNAKLGDFGTAKMLDRSCEPDDTRVMGTIGYMDPAYALTGKVSKQSDVYGFGVVMLETLCGRRVLVFEHGNPSDHLVEWVQQFEAAGRNIMEAADERFMRESSASDRKQMKEVMQLALACVRFEPNLRPSIAEIRRILQIAGDPSSSRIGDEVHELEQEDERDIPLDGTSDLPGGEDDDDHNYTLSSEQPTRSELAIQLNGGSIIATANASETEQIDCSSCLNVRIPPPLGSIDPVKVQEREQEDQKEQSDLPRGNENRDINNETVSPDEQLSRRDRATQPDIDSLATDKDTEPFNYTDGIDILIPPPISSVGPLQAHQKPIVKAILTSLCEIFRTIPDQPEQRDEMFESVRTCMAMLGMICSPMDRWKPLEDYLLHATKLIDRLKNKLHDENTEVSVITGSLSSFEKEILRRKQSIREDSTELQLSEERLANAQEDQLHQEVKIAYLEQQLRELRPQLEEAKEACHAKEKECELLKKRRDRQMQLLNSAEEAVNFASTSLEAKRKACEEKQRAISEVSEQVLARLASCSID